jgi:lipoprotein NlpI
VTEQIQAASQTQLSCHKFEFVVVALTILLLSMAGVAGVLPLIPESNASDSGIATGAAIQYKQMPSLQATLNGIATMGATAEVKAELFNSAGVDYLSRKDSHNAVLAFEKAVEVNPEFVAAYNNLGMAYLQDGDRKAAKEAFAFALKLQPGNSYAQQQLVN